MNATDRIQTAARDDCEVAERIKRSPPKGTPVEGDLRGVLRRELTPNEYCLMDVLLCADRFTFTGTVPQLAATAGLTLKQCKVARQSLKRRGMVKVTMNADPAHRGRHNSSMTLGAEAQRAFQSAQLNHTKLSVNKGLEDQKAPEGPQKAQDGPSAADVSKAPQVPAIYIGDSESKESTERGISAEAGSDTPSRVSPGQIQKVAAQSGVPSGQSPAADRRISSRERDYIKHMLIIEVDKKWTDEEIAYHCNVPLAAAHRVRMDCLRAPTHTRSIAMKALDRNRAHPEWMHKGTLDWRDNPNLKPGQRMVHLFEELTGREATGREKGILKWMSERGFLAATPEEFLTWMVENWRTIGLAIFDWADGYPAEPCLPWLRANFNDFWFAHVERADLDFKATDEAREGRRAWRDEHGAGDKEDSLGYRREREYIRREFEDHKRVWRKEGVQYWGDGPYADQIRDLFMDGRQEEAEDLMKETWEGDDDE